LSKINARVISFSSSLDAEEMGSLTEAKFLFVKKDSQLNICVVHLEAQMSYVT
jgi:hypothetical protein